MLSEVGLTVHWLVHLVADELKDISECLLILGTLGSFCQLEVYFGKVHANCLGNESFEQFEGEVKLEAISFICAGGQEF